MEEIYFTAEAKSGRIDKYLSEMLSEMSRSHIQKLIKDENVLVNERIVKANYKLNEGDEILV